MQRTENNTYKLKGKFKHKQVITPTYLECVKIQTKKRVTDLTSPAIEQIRALHYCKGRNITYNELKFVLSANTEKNGTINTFTLLSPFPAKFIGSPCGNNIKGKGEWRSCHLTAM